MIEEQTKPCDVASFFKKKYPEFQEGFLLVFGLDVRDKSDVLEIAESYRKLMWAVKKNGKKITKKDIYHIRGESVLLVRRDGFHHWPPRSENGKKKIKIAMPIDFHKGWHLVHFNLWKRKDLRFFWQTIFSDEMINDYRQISQIAEGIARNGKQFSYTGF